MAPSDELGLPWPKPLDFYDLTHEQRHTVEAEAHAAVKAFEDEINEWDEARVVILAGWNGMPQVYIMPLKNTSPPSWNDHVH